MLFLQGRGPGSGVLLLEVLVRELELGLLTLAPTSLIVKVDVRAVLVGVSDLARVLMALEPSQVLLVVAPRSLLELLGGEVLLESALLKVEDVKERVVLKLGEDLFLLDRLKALVGVVGRRLERIQGRVTLTLRQVLERGLEHECWLGQVLGSSSAKRGIMSCTRPFTLLASALSLVLVGVEVDVVLQVVQQLVGRSGNGRGIVGTQHRGNRRIHRMTRLRC